MAAIPDPVDLAVIAVPKAVPEVVDECLAKGVRGLVVITAGFRETGEAGAAVEERLRDLVRAAGVRMIGPNCMGVINAEPRVRLNATFAPVAAAPAALAFVEPVGRHGSRDPQRRARLGIGLTQFVSMGNKADVSGNDLLEYWEDDPATPRHLHVPRELRQPAPFTEIAKRVGAQEADPDREERAHRRAGARAATSHTGALAGGEVAASALLEQCGVLRADTIEELFDVARALDACPLPAGRRVAHRLQRRRARRSWRPTPASIRGSRSRRSAPRRARELARVPARGGRASQPGRHDRLGGRRRATAGPSKRCSPIPRSTSRSS